ncbi:helix-turn-helix domain-containing protein [Actinomadura parmotrematis]|uniref:Helix-turn-helix domain-containing protein n=1 Tax=Actinomadura parmotrematis TaxID=2864039 RepID=A0ABS7FY39_9ACTN|nr:helix-turn-helix transcriptional regulator [Actinomadura parmotrematis]MBW8484890.1 helix-turn-helix domain-containing protein [Actinomadura parmotrematis]
MTEVHPAGYSPTIKKRALSKKLVAARKEVGMTTTEVCKRLRWSPSKLNYIEKAKWIEPSSDSVADLCELYGIEGTERDGLIALAREARQRGWWTRYNDVFRSEFPGFEAAASTILTFQNVFLPGLLQTAAYTEQAIRADGTDDPAEVKRYLSARLERQQIIQRAEDPCRLHAIIDENVIARLGSSEKRTAQLQHLVQIAELPNVELQVIRTSVGLYPGTGEPFTYLQFADPSERDIVFLETTVDARLLEEKIELQRYMVRFDTLRASALDTSATRAFLLAELKDAG